MSNVLKHHSYFGPLTDGIVLMRERRAVVAALITHVNMIEPIDITIILTDILYSRIYTDVESI